MILLNIKVDESFNLTMRSNHQLSKHTGQNLFTFSLCCLVRCIIRNYFFLIHLEPIALCTFFCIATFILYNIANKKLDYILSDGLIKYKHDPITIKENIVQILMLWTTLKSNEAYYCMSRRLGRIKVITQINFSLK